VETFGNRDPSARWIFFDRKISNARFRDMISKWRKGLIVFFVPRAGRGRNNPAPRRPVAWSYAATVPQQGMGPQIVK
jgi:hypothetical protein